MAFPLPPGSTIGILGAGQLARMLALAAARLGFNTAVLDPDADACATRIATHVVTGDYAESAALARLAALSDVVTFEFENVPAAAVEQLTALGCAVGPNPRALAVAQDRIDEKTFLNAHGVATTAFADIATVEDIEQALKRFGPAALLKTRRDGYDGKGQTWVEGQGDARKAFERIGSKPAILEAPVPFTRELSVIAARGRDGEVTCYPPGENHHENGILRRTSAPARASAKTIQQAETIAARILTGLDYVGVMGVELFELAGGALLVNEIAPRVHNTGHWTLDGCEVDQFEQHIRAIAGWPLGPTHALMHVEMTNLLGPEVLEWKKLAGETEARVWIYDKGDPRPGRKMGHVNRLRRL
jgi:5-(carboxyamino)imidazole ribonucleotide synthase